VRKGSHRAGRRRQRLSLLKGGTMGKGRGTWFTTPGGGRGGGPNGMGVMCGGGGLERIARGQVAATAGRLRRAWVRWHGAWDQRRRGGPDAWVTIGEHGSAQMNSILCELFKNIQTSLNGFDPKADFPCSNNWLGRLEANQVVAYMNSSTSQFSFFFI
jgi:hypothetical protein